ncbi:MAG: mechanosensitive ion channel [Oscillospiraceae bacterium]|nr:mechanosensitive ion channel [Oscillospiraceae bacterium]
MDKFLESVTGWLTDLGTGLATKILAAVVIAVIGCLLIRLVMNLLVKVLEKSKLEKAAYSLVKTLVRTALYVLLALIVASSLGIDVTGIVALASVATLAVSLALQNMLANVIGGFTLLYTHPFKSGDYVEIAGQSGTVTEIGMSYTKLNTPDNKMISIPNSAVVAAQIVNYTTMGTRRAEITVTAAYSAPAEKVIETLLEVAKDERILQEPAAPFAALTGYGESSIGYVLRFWVNGSDYWDVYYKVNREIKVAFDKAGVEMTYPHLNVHLDK